MENSKSCYKIVLATEWSILSTVLDAFTKQILSYVLSPSLEVDFVLETVNKLTSEHGVSFQAENIIHSDQGCHNNRRYQ